jgi:hypothetical protein
MMWELVALGCLAVHGDLKEDRKSKLDRLWKAGDIIKELEELHLDFYSTAVTKTRTKMVGM